MSRRGAFASLGIALATALSACTTQGPPLSEIPLSVNSTPFFSDDGTLCGPSALASVLHHSGVPVTPDELSEQVYVPGLQGSLQAEMLGAIRRNERVAIHLQPDPTAIVEALDAGYPVLVLQRLRVLWQRAWHYAVVVTYLPEEHAFLLRSGTNPELRVGLREFEQTWEPGDRWAVVVLRPGGLPDFVHAAAFMDGVIGLEAAGKVAAAKQAYALAMDRWPEEPMFTFGYGNALAGEGDLREAAGVFEQNLARHPDHVATRNNLAWVLGELGCEEAALELLETTLTASGTPPPMQEILEGTVRELSERIEARTTHGTAGECTFP